jgi:hypothetical protein
LVPLTVFFSLLIKTPGTVQIPRELRSRAAARTSAHTMTKGGDGMRAIGGGARFPSLRPLRHNMYTAAVDLVEGAREPFRYND